MAALLLFWGAQVFYGQNPRRRDADISRFNSYVEKARPELPDSLELARLDSLHVADSLHRADSVAMLSKSSIDQPAFSTARDSVVEIFSDGQRMILYYGDVTVKYQDMTLTSELMEYDMNTGKVHAMGVYDTLSGTWKGLPVMTQGNKSYNMQEIIYNFNTRQASIKEVITKEDDAILHGNRVKMDEDNSMSIIDAKYTVCDADHPHYYMKLSSAKNISKPSKKTVFGPAHLVVEDVDLPLILPFGFIPKRPERATGMLMPTFGEENARGFYMRDAGMYFVFGDYLDLSVTGDLYSLGSWALDVNSRYKVNYKFNGSFSFTMSNDQTGEKGEPDFYQSRNFGVKWQHTQDSKSRPGTSFSASVNFSSPSNSKYNSRSVNEALQNQISSSISYGRNWNGKFNLSMNLLHSQNSRDSSYSFTLPNITFSMSTIYPFKQKNRVGKERFYEKISIGYNTSLQNRINFKASEFGQEGFLDKFQNGMTHNFSLGLPSMTLMKYITVNPSVSYGMNWFFRSSDYQYNPETDRVEQIMGKQLGHFGVTNKYSFSASASTRLYGMFNFGKFSKVQAIRHVISPSVSLSLSPDLATYANGYRTLDYIDKNGVAKTQEYNIYSGQLNSPPGHGRSATASISIGNNLEAKVKDFADTTGKGTKKVKLIDQLSFNTGYNFLADSLNMNTISASMSTNLFNKVNISMSAGFDPYAVDENGRKYNKFAVTKGQGLARMTNISASASYALSGDGKGKGNDGGSPAGMYQRIYYHPVTGEYIPGGWIYYTNPNVPWSVNFSYSFSMSRTFKMDEDLGRIAPDNKITQTINCNGNIKLTPKLAINASSGFDFQQKKITTSQMSFTYDLHCFNIAVSWVPTGTWKSYSFRIAANAATLADLLRFKKSSSYWDN